MQKKKPTRSDDLYIFDINLSPDSPLANKKTKTSRIISILGKQSLYDFAESIVDSFDFSFNHCFGFFDNLKNWTDSLNSYELFVDIPDVACESPESKSIKNTKIKDLFNVNDKMLFLFDYGDGWEFIIQLKKIDIPDMKKSYPLLIGSLGKAPKQHPD